MKFVLLMLFAAAAAVGQTRVASIAGTVLDAKTQKPIPAALVMAVRSGLPPLSKYTKSGGDGVFQIRGLDPGQYRLCVQAQGNGHLDPCRWNGNPVTVALASGQAAIGLTLRLAAASIVRIEVQDGQRLLSQLTRDGRRPELTVGIWGPSGLYYPAHNSGSPATAGNLATGASFELAVPQAIPLQLHFASRELKLGDATGAALPGNSARQPFQNAAGDLRPKIFRFTVLELLP